MEIRLAQHSGACYGVQRALDMALEAARTTHEAYSIGPLIHNPQVVEELDEKGIHVAQSPAELSDKVAIIRSHGVVPAVKRALESEASSVVDATCPHVARAQKAAAKLAREQGTVVVVGDEKHPEVEGLRAFAEEAGGRVLVVGDPAQIPSDLPKNIGVVVQTTSTVDLLDDVVCEIERCGSTPHVINTICSATTKRQEAAASLANGVDAMVVIGGHNSSNTTRLFEICKGLCPRSIHVETVDELSPEFFEGCEVVGVTAGASTPEARMSEVVEYLRTL